MIEQVSRDLDLYLKIGLALSIHGKFEGELTATVATIFPRKLGLEIPRPTSKCPFQEGERVGIRYWDRGAVVYNWDTEVIEISGLRNQRLAISMGRNVVVEKRRSCRVSLPLPFSFTVIGCEEAQLVGKEVVNSATQDISGGGLAFETHLPLRVGDQLEMNLHLPASPQLNARGWVVRSQPVPGQGKDLNSIALMFLQLEAGQQDRLLKFLAQTM